MLAMQAMIYFSDEHPLGNFYILASNHDYDQYATPSYTSPNWWVIHHVKHDFVKGDTFRLYEVYPTGSEVTALRYLALYSPTHTLCLRNVAVLGNSLNGRYFYVSQSDIRLASMKFKIKIDNYIPLIHVLVLLE